MNHPDGPCHPGTSSPVRELAQTQIIQGIWLGYVFSRGCEDPKERDEILEGLLEEGTFQLALDGEEEGAAR